MRAIDIYYGENQVSLPKYEPPISDKKIGRPRQIFTSRSIKQKPKTRPATKPPVQLTSPETKPQKPDIIPPEKLPKLDESLLARLSSRDRSQVLDNGGVKAAASAITRNGLHDYRTRVLLFLRYGYSAAAPQTINRSGEFIRTNELFQHVPSHRGLDIMSASLVCGLTPLALLREEAKFIAANKAEFPALDKLESLIQAEIKVLEATETD